MATLPGNWNTLDRAAQDSYLQQQNSALGQTGWAGAQPTPPSQPIGVPTPPNAFSPASLESFAQQMIQYQGSQPGAVNSSTGYTQATPPGFSSPVTAPTWNTVLGQQNSYANNPYINSPAYLAQQAQMMNQSIAATPGLYNSYNNVSNIPFQNMTNDQQAAFQYYQLYGNGGLPPGTDLNTFLKQNVGPNTMYNAPLSSFQNGGVFGGLQPGQNTPGFSGNTPYMGPGAPQLPGAPGAPVNPGAINNPGAPGQPPPIGAHPPPSNAPPSGLVPPSNPGGQTPPTNPTGNPGQYNPFYTPAGSGGNNGGNSPFSSLFSNPPNPTDQSAVYQPGQGPNTGPLPGAAGGADAIMGANAGDLGYLQQIASGGMPSVDTTPEWNAMVQAMQRPIAEGQANLNEQFNSAGGRFSSAYGTASADYQNQAQSNLQSTLGQLQVPAMMQAQQMTNQAAQQLGGFANSNMQQLSQQNFQSQLQQYMASLQAGQSMFGAGAGAAGQMAGLGAQGGMALNQGATQAGQNMFGAENQAGLQAAMQYMQMLGMGTGAAQSLSNLWQSNLGVGSQLGGQQYQTQQSGINNAYQEWLRTQPQNNPMLSYLMSIATSTPQLQYPTYQPGWFGQLTGGLGALAGGLGGAAALSDIRLKENLHEVPSSVGDELGLHVFDFNYKGDSTPQRGFIAQEVAHKYPNAVHSDEYGILLVDYGKLFNLAGVN